MQDVRVTVLTPTYQHDSFIAQCIESVRQQTFSDWEQIILDDGSTDNTESICRNYEKLDKRIRYVRRDNSGPRAMAELYNLGLSKSSGELIAILEGDDFWPRQKLSLQVDAMETPACLSYGRCAIVKVDGEFAFETGCAAEEQAGKNSPTGAALHLFYRQKNFIPAVTVVIRRDALEDIGGFCQGRGMSQVDFSTWCELALMGPFQFIDERLGYWRRHGKSITSTQFEKMTNAKYEFLECFNVDRGDRLMELGVAGSHLRPCRLSPFEIWWQGASQRAMFGELSFRKGGFIVGFLSIRRIGEFGRWSMALVSAFFRVDVISFVRRMS